MSGSREGWAVLIYNAEVSGEPESRLQRVKMRGWEGGEGCVAEAGLQGQRQDGVFLVDLVVFVKYFLFSPSVFFGKGMPACGKRNSHGEVVETPRMVPNKGIQPGRRLAFDVTPSRGCWAEGLFCPGAGWLLSHMGDATARLRLERCLVPGKEGEEDAANRVPGVGGGGGVSGTGSELCGQGRKSEQEADGLSGVPAPVSGSPSHSLFPAQQPDGASKRFRDTTCLLRFKPCSGSSHPHWPPCPVSWPSPLRPWLLFLQSSHVDPEQVHEHQALSCPRPFAPAVLATDPAFQPWHH